MLDKPPDPAVSSVSAARRAGFFGACFLLLVTVTGTVCAYYDMFSRFSPYDDEGCILLNVRDFVEGHRLYDDVHAIYGPFFYLWDALLARIGLLVLTHDGTRLYTVGVWLACTLLAALLVHRLTGSLLLAAIVQVLTLLHLSTLTYEPGHPQGLIALLLLGLPLLVAFAPVQRTWTAWAGIGVLLGCLALTKANVGVFAFLAVAFVLAAATPGRAAAIVRDLLALAIVLLPAVLMRSFLSEPWGGGYALIVTLAAVPMLFEVRDARGEKFLPVRTGLIACGALVLTTVVIAAAIVLRGTSPAGLLHGVLLQHARLQFIMPLSIGWGALVPALLAQTIWLRYRARCRGLDPRPGSVTLDVLLPALFFLVVLGCVWWEAPVVLLVLGLPFAWIGLVPGVEPRAASDQRLARRLLAALAVLQSLVAYPTAGSQKFFATLLLIPLATVYLGDVLGYARAHGGGTGTDWRKRPLLPGLAALLLVLLLQRTLAKRVLYDELPPLGLPGAERIHVPEDHVALYRWLDYNLRAHADTFCSRPGFNSLYLWTGLPPPNSYNTTHWMISFDAARQQELVNELARHPRACAIVSNPWTDFWTSKSTNTDWRGLPLDRYLDDEFRTLGSVSHFQFRVRREREDVELLYCARLLSDYSAPTWTARLVLPALGQRRAHRVTIHAGPPAQVIADTDRTSSTSALEVLPDAADPGAAGMSLQDGLSLEQPQTWLLRWARPTLGRDVEVRWLRLYDGQGQWIATVPFLD